MRIKIIIIFCVIINLAAGQVLALMQSENFNIRADSLNIGGTDEGSANYRVQETIGETGSGESQSANYKINSGLPPMMEEGMISITTPADVTMNPVIPGISGGTGNGLAQWTVMTDNAAGYTLKISASGSPAMQCAAGGCGSENFSDYTPAVPGSPDFDWLIGSSSAEFGLTPEGSDIVQKFRDNGSVCNAGNLDTTDKCWYGPTYGQEAIASSYSSNQPAGTPTTIKFRAQSGSSKFQIEGNYQAIITVTAIPN